MVSIHLKFYEYASDFVTRLGWWAQRMACTNKTEESLDNGKVHHSSWTCDDKDGMLQHYKVEDLGTYDSKYAIKLADRDIGHCWADTEPNLSQISVPQLPTVIRSSEIIMRFFDGVSKT
jgi:hypothetical protein